MPRITTQVNGSLSKKRTLHMGAPDTATVYAAELRGLVVALQIALDTGQQAAPLAGAYIHQQIVCHSSHSESKHVPVRGTKANISYKKKPQWRNRPTYRHI
jgi:hypothetical protein